MAWKLGLCYGTQGRREREWWEREKNRGKRENVHYSHWASCLGFFYIKKKSILKLWNCPQLSLNITFLLWLQFIHSTCLRTCENELYIMMQRNCQNSYRSRIYEKVKNFKGKSVIYNKILNIKTKKSRRIKMCYVLHNGIKTKHLKK